MAADNEELKEIEKKIENNEELTKEEQKKVLGAPESSDEEEEIDPSKTVIKADDEAAEDEDDEEEDEDGDGKKKVDAEENPSEKGAKPATAKKEADDAAKQAERRKLIEAEAEKPIDQADIEQYSPSERALFFELKKERRKRQEAQAEADTLKFQKKKDDEKKRLEREREAAEAEEDPFEGKEDDDILTVAEIKKALKLGKKQPKAEPKEETATDELQQRANLMQERVWLYEARDKHGDVNEIVPYADELLRGDKEAEAEVRDVVLRGGNPVVAIYNLIKTHPKFPEIEAKIKAKAGKPAEAPTEKGKKPSAEEEAKTNKERAERIEKNKEKPKTTGSGGGAAPQTGEYTIQELLDMPDKEFARLPKEQRDRILQKF